MAMDISIHPRAVAWKRDGITGYSSVVGVVWRGADGNWHAQPTNYILDENFRSWKAAARACEEYHGRRSRLSATV